MSHKLKPSKFIEIILTKPNNQQTFTWHPAEMRSERFDNFINDLEAKFSVIDWDYTNEDQEKIEILSLLGGAELRQVMTSLKGIAYEEVLKKLKKSMYKDVSEMELLATAINLTQSFGEPLEAYFSRVESAHDKVDWDNMTSENIKDVMVTLTLAHGSGNSFLKGCCIAGKAFKDVDLAKTKEFALKSEPVNKFKETGYTGPYKCYQRNPFTGKYDIPNVAPVPRQTLFGTSTGCFGAPDDALSGTSSRGFGVSSGGFGASSSGFEAPTGGFGAPSGGLFGKSSGGFGAQANYGSQAKPSLFGAPAQSGFTDSNVSPEENRFFDASQNDAAQGGGLVFCAAKPQTGGFGQGAGGGFGQGAGSGHGFGLFGQPRPLQSRGLFGASPAPPEATVGGLFGATPTQHQNTGLFGTPVTPPSLFGATTSKKGGLFGSNDSSSFGVPANPNNLFGAQAELPDETEGKSPEIRPGMIGSGLIFSKGPRAPRRPEGAVGFGSSDKPSVFGPNSGEQVQNNLEATGESNCQPTVDPAPKQSLFPGHDNPFKPCQGSNNPTIDDIPAKEEMTEDVAVVMTEEVTEVLIGEEGEVTEVSMEPEEVDQ